MNKRTILIAALIIAVLCALIGICVGTTLVTQMVVSPSASSLRNTVQLSADGSQSSSADSILHSKGEQVLRLSGGLPPTLDPAMVQDSIAAEYVVHLFSGLVSLNADLEVVPDLATGWDTSADGLTYTFHLDPDACFADGNSITSADIVYSLERACSPALGSPVATSYLDDIVGVRDYAGGQASRISGLEAPDDYTVVIRIDAPKAYFLSKLTYCAAFVVDGEQIEADGDAWMLHPNGSGPFVLDSIDSEEIVFVRNENYYGQAPALDRVVFVLGGGLPITMYENDRLDIVAVDATEVERVLDPHNPLAAEHHVVSELSVQYLGLNVDVPPFDDPVVRQAFAHAIDKEKIADLTLKETAVAANGILPPGMPDHDPDLQGLSYDPGKALELLATSSYGSVEALPPITLTVAGTSGHMVATDKAIVSMFEEALGVKVMVEQVEWSDFLTDLSHSRYQMFSAGWIADYPDSQDFVDLLFYSNSPQNHTNYSNPAVDALVLEARTEQDSDRRTELYRQAERVIVSDAPWIPLTHSVNHTLVKPYISGYTTSPSLYPWLAVISVEDPS